MRASGGNDIPFRSSEIVFHPDVPSKVAQRLQGVDPRYLVPFNSKPPAQRGPGAIWSSWLWVGLWSGIATGVSIAAAFAALAAQQYDNRHPAAAFGRPDNIAILAMFAALAAWIMVVLGIGTIKLRRPQRQSAAEARLYHRRYIVPLTDLDRDAMNSWSRVVKATRRITGSDVVRQQRIDTVRMTTVLPHRLWDIAEKLAQISALREEHREILTGLDPDDPDLEVVLRPQRRARALADEDIERQVRQLEIFADRAEEADAALRREQAVRRLTTLNDPHVDLLARIGPSGDDAEIAALTSHDLQAVIERANEAVNQANEAVQSLGLPDSPGH